MAHIGCWDEALPSPSLCVVLGRARRNAERMRLAADAAGVSLRPHVKTHKTPLFAALQCAPQALAESSVVVSTLAEAAAFAGPDIKLADILYGVPVEPSKFQRLGEIISACPGTRFSVLLDSEEALDALEAYPPLRDCGVFLKVDCGYHRAGVDPATESAQALARRLASSPSLRFMGLYSHSGNSYNCIECVGGCGEHGGGDDPGAGSDGTPMAAAACSDARAEQQQGEAWVAARRGAASVGSHELHTMTSFARRLYGAGVRVPTISIGATPSASSGGEFAAKLHATAAALLDDCGGTRLELHPGNYIFYDRQQRASGSCAREDIACYVLSRVIARYPARGELLIDAGSCALHKDTGGLRDGTWGELLDHPGLVLRRMSQESSVVGRADGAPLSSGEMEAFSLGACVRVLPNHSCMTAAAHPHFFVVEEAGEAGGASRSNGAPLLESFAPQACSSGTYVVLNRVTPVKFW